MLFMINLGWPPDRALRLATVAADHNFDGITCGEHHLPGSITSPLLWLTRFTGNFPQFQYATDVALLPFHHPVRMASEAAMLDHLTGGKFALGIGLGYVQSEFDLYDLNIRQRRAMFEEHLTIMKQLWTGNDIAFHGKFFSVNGCLPIQPLTPGGPKVWIGGQVKPAIDRAARMGDAFVGGISTPIQRFKDFVNTYRVALGLYGKDPNQAEVPIMRTVWCDPTDNVRDEINRIVSAQYQQSFAIREGHPMQFDEYATDYAHTVENRCIVGTPDTCIEMVEAYERVGVTGILCSFVSQEHTVDQIAASVQLFGDKVITYFKQPENTS
jgi:alkanesulfonate monooxygenase SsuD/methylene tetrahydromethanopterin reductase-like flavin-dependent oxidoreductase (luciferase family)